MEAIAIMAVLGFILLLLVLPALIFFLIERGHRQRLQARVDSLELSLGRLLRADAAARAEKAKTLVTPPPETPTFTFEKPMTEIPAEPSPESQPVVRPPDLPPMPPEKPLSETKKPPLPVKEMPPVRPPTRPTPPGDGIPYHPILREESKTFEQKLATQWTTWLGAIALLLAAVFLVKIGFEQGWFGPLLRVTFAYLGGIFLIGWGEKLRDNSYYAAQGSSAGGIAMLFAATIGASTLYGFISSTIAFVLLFLISMAGVLLSLRAGVMVAVVGLLGGFSLPILLRTTEPHVWSLLGYLVLLHLATSFAAARRGWGWVTGLSTLAMVIWGFIFVNQFMDLHPLALGVLLLFTGGSLFVPQLKFKGKESIVEVQATTLALFFIILSFGVKPQRLEGWVMMGLLSLAVIYLSMRKPFHIVLFAGLVITILRLAIFVGESPKSPYVFPILITAGLLWTLGCYLRHWWSEIPVDNLAAAAVASLGAVGLIYWLGKTVPLPMPSGALSLGWGVFLIILALPVLRKGELSLSARRLAALLGGATFLVSAAVPMELERAWITVAWAIEIPILIYLDSRLRVPLLRMMAHILGIAVMVRLVLNPAIVSYPLGDIPVLNWLLYGFGISLAAFFIAGIKLRKMEQRLISHAYFWGARILLTVLCVLEIRHVFQDGKLTGPVTDLYELTTYVVLGFLLTYLFRFINVRWYSLQDALAMKIWGLGTLAFMLFGTVLVFNPLWNPATLGDTPFLNGLLYFYGLPILLCMIAVWRVFNAEPVLQNFYRTFAYGLMFLLVTLEVRHLFHPYQLNRGSIEDMEMYTYSAAWILIAVGTLAAGIVRKSKILRYVSLAVMLLAVIKVFIVDMPALSLIHRFFSFLCLGISLFLISIIYQRFVFRREVEFEDEE